METTPLQTKEAGQPQKVQLEITWASVFRVLAGILFAYMAMLLWPIFKLLLISVVLAVALHPLVLWLCGKGLPRWLGLSLASAAFVVVIVACFAVIGPLVYR